MSAIPIPRKTTRDTYDVDGFIDQLLASRKLDQLTEVFADKAAYKIKNLDPPKTTKTDNIERIRWSKKSHKNTDKEQSKDDHAQSELISIKLRDDDTESEESRKLNPAITLKDGEISPNELRLKYKYLTRNATTKNFKDHNKLKKEENNEEHALNVDENDDLKKEPKNEVKEDQNESNESHEKPEQYHNDRDGDLHYKSAKIHYEWDKDEHLDIDDNAKDGTHSNEEHSENVRPEFKSKTYSVEHELAHNTSDEASEENFHGVASSEEKSHEEIDHTKEVTLTREPTTTRFKVEAVTNVTSNTLQKDHTNDDSIGTAHFRAQISEEQVQAKSDEKERKIRNLPDSELKKLSKQHITDKKMRALNDTQEKEKREREGLEKILKDRLEEEETLRNAAIIYERSEREERKQFGAPELEENTEEIPSDVVVVGVNALEKPREELEKELLEESKRQEKQINEWAAKLEKERLQRIEELKQESDRYLKEEKKRLGKVLKDKMKNDEELAEQSKAYEASKLEQANKVLKDKKKYEEFLHEEAEKHKKLQYENLKKFIKEKAKFEEQLEDEKNLAKEKIKQKSKAKGELEKGINKTKQVEKDKKEIHVERPTKAKKVGPEQETKKESIKGKKEESKKDKKKEPEKEKKNKPKKEKKKSNSPDYSDYRAVDSEQMNTKEKQKQYRIQKEYENKLEREIREEDESSVETESEVAKITQLHAMPRSKPSFNKVSIVPFKNIEDEYNNRIAESESAANDDDRSSGEDELVIMSSTTNPMIRREGNKEYTFVQNPEYAEYHEAYAKMQKEHPFNPADFLK